MANTERAKFTARLAELKRQLDAQIIREPNLRGDMLDAKIDDRVDKRLLYSIKRIAAR